MAENLDHVATTDWPHFTGERRTGRLASARLIETSGLAASLRKPDLIWAINDSGQPSHLHAINTRGDDLDHWQVNAPNRDWEDLASLEYNGEAYLLIADTGDNLKRHDEYVIHVVPEPIIDGREKGVLQPIASIRFRYEDGPHNVEAMAAFDKTIYLITKDDGSDQRQANLYRLPFTLDSGSDLLIASKAGAIATLPSSFESLIASAVVGVNLNAITAFDFSPDGTFAVMLTYRELRLFERGPAQDWATTLMAPGRRILSHSLGQAEAMTVSPNRMVWFTSEGHAAPLIGTGIAPDA